MGVCVWGGGGGRVNTVVIRENNKQYEDKFWPNDMLSFKDVRNINFFNITFQVFQWSPCQQEKFLLENDFCKTVPFSSAFKVLIEITVVLWH